MPRPKPATIDDYIASCPMESREALEQIRERVRKQAPKAEECISYAIASFFLDGRALLYFAGYANHVSIYPVPRSDAALLKELEPYQAGKGTLQFQLAKKLPLPLIGKVVKAHLKEHAERAKARVKKK
ncbi:MAG TPA: DUF1801 domain-containing protein [Flavobacteriales bacterium]|jgi:uncharacterized protein YdhG (YjbR/CyaY superfamily)|nr:DUF1801 domain-containing protein [Flavobacteriales bacterium]